MFNDVAFQGKSMNLGRQIGVLRGVNLVIAWLILGSGCLVFLAVVFGMGAEVDKIANSEPLFPLAFGLVSFGWFTMVATAVKLTYYVPRLGARMFHHEHGIVDSTIAGTKVFRFDELLGVGGSWKTDSRTGPISTPM